MDLTNAFIPQILDYTPTPATAGVIVRPEISIHFSMDMLIGTLVSDQAAADAYLAANVICTNNASGARVNLSFVSYDAREATLVIGPSTALDPGETYLMSILPSFASAAGRGIGVNETWTFTVAAADIPMPTLANPIDGYTSTETPVFVWQLIRAGHDDTIAYHLQISDAPTFATLVYESTDMAANYEDRLTTMVLVPGTTYYWRVRVKINDVTGPWSSMRAFRISRPQSIATTPGGTIFDSFGLTTFLPPPGSSNLTEWPTIKLGFNRLVMDSSVSTGIVVTACDVDSGKKTVVTDMTQSVNGSQVDLVISGSIASNTRYAISVAGVQDTSGQSIANPQIMAFTGPYLPLYSTSEVLRSEYGRFLTRFTDDEINFQIHRASIKCNRFVMNASSVSIASLLTAMDITFDMASYVEAYSAYCLIQLYQFELLEQAGRRMALDTLQSQVDANLLSEIEALLKDLEKQVKRDEQALRGGAPAPKTGVKSSQWDPSGLYDDISIGNLPRGYF